MKVMVNHSQRLEFAPVFFFIEIQTSGATILQLELHKRAENMRGENMRQKLKGAKISF